MTFAPPFSFIKGDFRLGIPRVGFSQLAHTETLASSAGKSKQLFYPETCEGMLSDGNRAYEGKGGCDKSQHENEKKKERELPAIK